MPDAPPSPPPLDLRSPATYPHWVESTMRYSDQDPVGHVNNAVYVTWFEACRVDYIAPFVELEQDLDFVLVNMNIDFHQEAHFPGTVRVGGRILRLGNTSIHSVYGVFLDDRCLASARCVNVFFDTQRRHATPPPARARDLILAEITPS